MSASKIRIEDMHYTDFRAEMYKLLDEAVELSQSSTDLGEYHINMEDEIDSFLIRLTEKV